MFDDLKRDSTDKLIKIKLYLSEIDAMIPTPPALPNEFQNTLKGLFFVYLYGVFEMVVTKTVGRTIDELNSSGAKISECKVELFSLIFSAEYDALYGVGESKKWPRRWDISKKFAEDQPIDITDTLFPTDGRNIKKNQLESISNSFGNSHPIFPRQETQGYLEELVRYRNFIAHGDMLPQEIGRNFSIPDLKKRCERIDELCTYLIDNYEAYITGKEYLKQ